MHSLASSRIVAQISVEYHKQAKKTSPLYSVWVVAKCWGHGGYSWYAVTDDGALLCRACVRSNYRQIVDATLHTPERIANGWQVVGHTYSGEMEENEPCAHCGASCGPNDPEAN